VCDDHFQGKWAEHYKHGCEAADLVTCNSAEMARVIAAQTGRAAVVIGDPYEQPEGEPRVSDHLLWFGHKSNLPDLLPWLERLGDIEIVTNIESPRVTTWTPGAMNDAFERAGLVVIPTGKSLAKSGNRAIESLRRGLFVVCGYMPAYADLGLYIGDIADGVDWALTHRHTVLRRIKDAQDYIHDEYGIERIGAMWKRTLSG
jgi:hypothetical protein